MKKQQKGKNLNGKKSPVKGGMETLQILSVQKSRAACHNLLAKRRVQMKKQPKAKVPKRKKTTKKKIPGKGTLAVDTSCPPCINQECVDNPRKSFSNPNIPLY